MYLDYNPKLYTDEPIEKPETKEASGESEYLEYDPKLYTDKPVNEPVTEREPEREYKWALSPWGKGPEMKEKDLAPIRENAEQPLSAWERAKADVGAAQYGFLKRLYGLVPVAGSWYNKVSGIDEAAKGWEERATKGLNEPSKAAHEWAQSFLQVIPDVIVTSMTGGAAKAGLVGRVLPSAMKYIEGLGDFARGAMVQGLIRGAQEDGSVTERTVKALREGLKEGAMGLAYERLPSVPGEMIAKKASTLPAKEAAKAIEKAIKINKFARTPTCAGISMISEAMNTLENEGRLPTAGEMAKAGLEGVATDIGFRIVGGAKKATKRGVEKLALSQIEKQFQEARKSGDINKAVEALDVLAKSKFVRDEIKQAVFDGIEQTKKNIYDEALKVAELKKAEEVQKPKEEKLLQKEQVAPPETPSETYDQSAERLYRERLQNVIPKREVQASQEEPTREPLRPIIPEASRQLGSKIKRDIIERARQRKSPYEEALEVQARKEHERKIREIEKARRRAENPSGAKEWFENRPAQMQKRINQKIEDLALKEKPFSGRKKIEELRKQLPAREEIRQRTEELALRGRPFSGKQKIEALREKVKGKVPVEFAGYQETPDGKRIVLVYRKVNGEPSTGGFNPDKEYIVNPEAMKVEQKPKLSMEERIKQIQEQEKKRKEPPITWDESQRKNAKFLGQKDGRDYWRIGNDVFVHQDGATRWESKWPVFKSLRKDIINDKENIQGIQGSEREGQELGRTVQNQRGSREATGTGGVFQTSGKEKSTKEVLKKPVSQMSDVEFMVYFEPKFDAKKEAQIKELNRLIKDASDEEVNKIWEKAVKSPNSKTRKTERGYEIAGYRWNKVKVFQNKRDAVKEILKRRISAVKNKSYDLRREKERAIKKEQKQVATKEILTKAQKPFKTKGAAKLALRRKGLSDTHEVVQVDGGWIGREKEKAIPKKKNKSQKKFAVEEEIPEKLAYEAYRGISMVPDKRAKSVRKEYAEYLNKVHDEIMALAKTKAEKEIAIKELERFKKGYLKRYLSWLATKSRTISPMITGPAKFPVERNRKIMDVEYRKMEDLTSYTKKALKAIKKKVKPEESKIISSTDRDAIDKLKDKLKKLIDNQETYKGINKIVRKKGISEDEKIKLIQEKYGFSAETARKIFKPDYMGNIGIPAYVLKNNNANIRRIKSRITELEQRKEKASSLTEGKIIENIENGQVEANYNDGFLRIWFDAKPPKETRIKLKKQGFRWAPSEGSWRRKLTDNALRAARLLYGEDLFEKKKIKKSTRSASIKNPADVRQELKKRLGNKIDLSGKVEIITPKEIPQYIDLKRKKKKPDPQGNKNLSPLQKKILKRMAVDPNSGMFGFIMENGDSNFSYKKISAKTIESLEKRGLIAYEPNDDIWVLREVLDGFYEGKQDKLFSQNGIIEGFVKDGKAYLVQGNIKKGEATQKLIHEVGAHLLRLGLKDKAFNKILKDFKRREKLSKTVKDAYDHARKIGTPKEHLDEEALAYVVEKGAWKEKGIKGIVGRLFTKIKAFMVDKLGIPARILTEKDLQRLAVNAIRKNRAIRKSRTVKYSKNLDEISDVIKDVYKQKKKEDLAKEPFIKNVKNKWEKSEAKRASDRLVETFNRTFTPENIGKFGKEADAKAAELVRRHQRIMDIVDGMFKERREWFEKLPEQARVDFLMAMEENSPKAFEKIAGGNKMVASALQQIAKEHREFYDKIHKLESSAGIKVGYIQNYVPHIWKDPEKATEFYERYAEQMGVDRFTKLRTVDKIKIGLEHGLELKTTNPEEVLLTRLQSAHKAIVRKSFIDYLKEKGLALKASYNKDELKQMLKDAGIRFSSKAKTSELKKLAIKKGVIDTKNMVQVNGPDGKQYYVSQDVLPLMENAGMLVGKGKSLWTHPGNRGRVYRGLMEAKNTLIPLKLGLSAFHLVHEATIHGSALRAALLEKAIKTGKIDVKKLVTAGLTQRKDVKLGLEMQKWWDTPDENLTEAQRTAVKFMEMGGFSPKQSEVWRMNAKKSFKKALANQKYPKAVAEGVRSILEAAQAPLFEKYIPGIKNAAYLKEAKLLVERKPELLKNEDALRKELRKIAKSVDNRYGELAYDTLFWNRTLKDIGIGSTLSMGWNLGFLREFGGATIDAGKFIKKALQGKVTREDITRKMLFAVDYTIQSMLIGAVLTYLFTGKAPDDLLDYFYPDTGIKAPDGTEIRYNTPFYTREYFAAAEHIRKEGPISGLVHMAMNKANPTLAPLVHAITNKDYFGVDIRDPHDPLLTQAKDLAKYLSKEWMLPISITTGEKAKERLGVWKGFGMSLAGFGIAPRYITMTPVQKEIFDEFAKNKSGMDKKTWERLQIKRKLRLQLMQTGQMNPNDLQKAIEDGVFGYDAASIKRGIKSLVKTAKITSDKRIFHGLPAETQVSLLSHMAKKDFDIYWPHATNRAKIMYQRSK